MLISSLIMLVIVWMTLSVGVLLGYRVGRGSLMGIRSAPDETDKPCSVGKIRADILFDQINRMARAINSMDNDTRNLIIERYCDLYEMDTGHDCTLRSEIKESSN